MMLTEAQSATFDRNGYLVLPQFLDEKVLDPVRETIGRHVEERVAALHADGKISSKHDQAPFEQRWALIAQEYCQNPNHRPLPRVWGGTDLLSPAIYALYTDSHLTARASSLLGPEITANGDFWVRPMIRDVPNTAFAWHQDSFYYGGKPAANLQILSVWIPLVDVDKQNGCLQMIPGSHRLGPLDSQLNESGQREPLEVSNRYGPATDVPMRTGDVLLFHNLTLHASGTHTVAGHVRWSIDLRYMRSDKGFGWHSLGDEFDRQYPTFTACSADPGKVMSFRQWRAKWQGDE